MVHFDVSKAEQAGRKAIDEYAAELQAAADPELGQFDDDRGAVACVRELAK